MKLKLSCLLLIPCFALSGAFGRGQWPTGSTGEVAKGVILIRAGRLIDVKAGRYLTDQGILIEDGRIREVGPYPQVLPHASGSALAFDLSQATVLPGLIDCHTHLLQNLSGPRGINESDRMTLNISQLGLTARVLLGAAMARQDLEAGITTVRDLGNSGIGGDVALRDAIRVGWVAGPRIVAATRAIAPAGGQFDAMQSEVARAIVEQEYVAINGPGEARGAVREALFAGADVIKVIVDAGSMEVDPQEQAAIIDRRSIIDEVRHTGLRVLDEDEIRAIVEEAHRVGVRVAAHAITNTAISAAAAAGVDSIEHAYQVSDENLRLMHDKGIYLVPTDFPDTPREADRLRRAIKLGVKIAAGSDRYGTDLTRMTRGQDTLGVLLAYQQSGMSPLEVIRTATIDAAGLLGWPDRVGSIEPGRYADIIAVIGDPLKDVSELLHVDFVMKGGVVFKDKIGSPASGRPTNSPSSR
jgi:imidazolonepropionase-like amidohydrolase